MESNTRPDLHSSIAGLQLEELEEKARHANGGQSLPLRDWVALAEAWRIAQALRETRGNRSAAARALGIGRRTLYSKMEKLGLEPIWMVGASSPKSTNGSNGAEIPRPNGAGHEGPEA